MTDAIIKESIKNGMECAILAFENMSVEQAFNYLRKRVDDLNKEIAELREEEQSA